MLKLTLRKIRSEKEKTRSRAVKKLCKSRNVRAVQPLISILKDGNAEVRASTALALGGICDTQAIQPLLGLLDDGDAEVQDAAALALGMIRDIHTGDRIVPLLEDKDRAVQAEARERLKELGYGWADESVERD